MARGLHGDEVGYIYAEDEEEESPSSGPGFRA